MVGRQPYLVTNLKNAILRPRESMPSPDGGAERLGGLGESHHSISMLARCIELRCIIMRCRVHLLQHA